MKKALLILALLLIPATSQAKTIDYFKSGIVVSEFVGFSVAALTASIAGFAVVPLNVYGVDPWTPLAKIAFGDKGAVEYSYPKGKNGI